MAKLLLVTGRLAEPIVRESVKRSGTAHVIDIAVAPIDVAALMTTDYIARFLISKGVKKGDYDLIIVPGLVKGSCRVIEDIIGIKAVKGTINAYDLVELLKLDDLSILSTDVPADDVIRDILINRNVDILVKLEKKACSEGFSIDKLCIPINPPPIRVVSEIAFAHTLPQDVLLKKVKHLIDSGADIISLGFEALNPHPDDVYRVVKLVKKEFDYPLAIDTAIPSEIVRGVEAGCDIVINIDMVNVDKVAERIKDVAVVVIPRDPKTNLIPKSVKERVEVLKRTVDYVKERGVEKVIADAILDPLPNLLLNSFLAYHTFKTSKPEIPLFVGIGNVTELIDVDSVGVNAILVELAYEVGASLVLTSEHSTKTFGSTREVKIASQMVSLAHTLGVPPKDLGISLLILKDKKAYKYSIDEKVDIVVVAEEKHVEPELDPIGVFRVNVNHDEGCIEALYIGRKGRILIKGRSAKALRDEIIARGLVTQLSHAMYLGAEFAKAEEALRLGKNYVQEAPLFKLPKPMEIHQLNQA